MLMLLTDCHWKKIEPLIPKQKKHPLGGRPFAEDRKCLEGIVWILRTGSQWSELPDKFPSYSTCWRRLVFWQELGVFRNVWQTVLSEINADEKIDWENFYIDGSFASAKKGGDKIGKKR